jgi:hypothetical protein
MRKQIAKEARRPMVIRKSSPWRSHWGVEATSQMDCGGFARPRSWSTRWATGIIVLYEVKK